MRRQVRVRFFFSSRRRHTRFDCDWSSDVCSSDLFHNGAQPIDQFVFKDRDGAFYIVYGGWRHCNVARLNDDFTGLAPLPNGAMFKEVTPKGYVEGAFMLQKGGKYYFMWSEGGWTGPDYAVAYAVG